MIQVASLNLRNPYLNASGIYSQIPELYKFWQPLGVGALVTKTITFDERMGYKGRRMVINKEKGYMINRMGLPNPGLQKTIELLKEYKSKFKTPLIV
ncbi:MAG TPA: dihydroorotate dehydrogenase, partial [bacterium]|nr:dihydroorotate dehydrogenase [bacterium]